MCVFPLMGCSCIQLPLWLVHLAHVIVDWYVMPVGSLCLFLAVTTGNFFIIAGIGAIGS